MTNQELAKELHEAAQQALQAGHTHAAAILAAEALQVAGKTDPQAQALKKAAQQGLQITPEDVQKILQKLAPTPSQEITVEISPAKLALTALTIITIATILTQTLPPWTDAILIPLAALLATTAILYH